jgi:hypothetical protein
VPLALDRAARHAGLAIDEAHETEDAARARVRGRAFVDAVDAIRRALPADEPYLLIDKAAPEEGAANWVRYELAPRRAILIRGERSGPWLRQHVPAGIQWVVVARGRAAPPSLHPRFEYLHRLPGREAGG